MIIKSNVLQFILNENQYKEYKVSDISPKGAKDIVSTHTLSFDYNLSVIDAAITIRKNIF